MNKERFKNIFIRLAAIAVIGLILAYSKSLSKGVGLGIALCFNNLIPSLFLFMILSIFFMNTGIGITLLSPFLSPLSKLLRISKEMAAVFCFSLLGGFPIGAKLIADAVKQQKIDTQTAERMLAFSINCGPAFLISAVSIPIFGSHSVGIIVYCSQIAAAFIVGILSTRKISRKNSAAPSPAYQASYSSELVNSVQSSIRSMALICALVLIFSGFTQILRDTGILQQCVYFLQRFMTQEHAEPLLLGILEITSGCSALRPFHSFPLLIFISGFGGICVHLQIKAILSAANISMKLFYFYRPLYILVSYLFSMFLVRLFGGTAAVFSQTQTTAPAKLYSISPVISVMLIILSLLLLLSAKNSDIIKPSE